MLLTCVKTLCDRGGIDEEAAAEGTADVWVELVEGKLGLQKRKETQHFTETTDTRDLTTRLRTCLTSSSESLSDIFVDPS